MYSLSILILALTEIGISAPLALSQTPPSEFFDAVAIKPWNMERGKLGVQTRGGGLEAIGVTLRDLIADAYEVNDQWIAGTSNWMESERYNIHATAGRPATRSELMAMLQKMLADRFHLNDPSRAEANESLCLGRGQGWS